MIGTEELRGWGWGRCKQHIKHMFFDLLQLLRGACTEKIIKKTKTKNKNGQVLNKPQMRLLLQISGGTFYQIQTDIYLFIFLFIYF